VRQRAGQPPLPNPVRRAEVAEVVLGAPVEAVLRAGPVQLDPPVGVQAQCGGRRGGFLGGLAARRGGQPAARTGVAGANRATACPAGRPFAVLTAGGTVAATM